MRQIYIYILRYRDLTGNRNNTQNKTADRVSWPTTTNKQTKQNKLFLDYFIKVTLNVTTL